MVSKPIYSPSGRAGEYGDYALNIYTGCPHACFYCFAPSVLHKDRETYHTDVKPREGIVGATEKQLASGGIKGKLIHLCFSCDPFPIGCDTTATREIIKLIKESGNHAQLLTKNGIGAMRDLDLLDENDWVGITYAGYKTHLAMCPDEEPNAGWPIDRLRLLVTAKEKGIHTWVSCEPVFDVGRVYQLIETAGYIDKFKIGKLNYHPSDINWGEFGRKAEELCIKYGRTYYIKEDLRKEMEKHDG